MTVRFLRRVWGLVEPGLNRVWGESEIEAKGGVRVMLLMRLLISLKVVESLLGFGDGRLREDEILDSIEEDDMVTGESES
jgi:hypothetical protein